MGSLKNKVRQIIYSVIKPPVVKVRNSNSQAGEDRVLSFLFGSMGLKSLSYIDIGANDPVISNNTYLFSRPHNRGILVEPDAYYMKRIREARPNDSVIQAAVATAEGTADFYIFDEPTLNTLSKEEAMIRQKTGKHKLRETTKIRLVTIEKIIQDYLGNKTPNLISLDVEGIDYEILKAFDFQRYPVPVWIVETCEYSEGHVKPKVKPILDLMLERGYFVYADTYINTVFVDKQWFYNYKNEA